MILLSLILIALFIMTAKLIGKIFVFLLMAALVIFLIHVWWIILLMIIGSIYAIKHLKN
ncbi:hypothetical protein ACKP2L_06035 [Oenococcus alcoholitolerans]|uniref:hypothetical protein n=1 Tax=Oenococcus alcoholitolerans TaxID=931074 RepID=UPI003F70C2FA